MPFPEKIPVKISSEAAGWISFTPVVRQELQPSELLGFILQVTGKDVGRILEVLRQGTVVRGASRFRWAPFDAEGEEIAAALRVFPDPEPGRPFDAGRCVRARLTGGRAAIDLERDAASRKSWFQRRSFWQILLQTAGSLTTTYQQYSYAGRADVYEIELSREAAAALRDHARLLRYPGLETAVREYGYTKLELWVER